MLKEIPGNHELLCMLGFEITKPGIDTTWNIHAVKLILCRMNLSWILDAINT